MSATNFPNDVLKIWNRLSKIELAVKSLTPDTDDEKEMREALRATLSATLNIAELYFDNLKNRFS